MLFQIFKKAVANDYLVKNPVEYADKMRKEPPKRKEAFTADEVRYLMENLPENKIGWSIRLLLSTGMRTQELLGLEPRHIAKDGSAINFVWNSPKKADQPCNPSYFSDLFSFLLFLQKLRS